jgi:hypothetical protein
MMQRVARSFFQCIHDMSGSRDIRVAYAQVDKVCAAPDCLSLHLIDGGKKIRGKVPDTGSQIHGDRFLHAFFLLRSNPDILNYWLSVRKEEKTMFAPEKTGHFLKSALMRDLSFPR